MKSINFKETKSLRTELQKLFVENSKIFASLKEYLLRTDGYLSYIDCSSDETALSVVFGLKSDTTKMRRNRVVLRLFLDYATIIINFLSEENEGKKHYSCDPTIDVEGMEKEMIEFLTEGKTEFEGFIREDEKPKAQIFTISRVV